MFTEVPTGIDNVIRIDCQGKLTKDDLQRMHQLLHERLPALGRPGLVIGLDEFDGYDSPGAFVEDFRMDLAHRNDFSRIAMVGENTWEKWGANLADALTTGELKWFDTGEMKRAMGWAAGK
jgi:hypothetical protein